jgi:hypothetical protein
MDVLEKAMQWASTNKPNSSLQNKSAFANSVQYLVTGYSGGFGGPSIREHLVSWSLAVINSRNDTSLRLTMQYPDGTIPTPGGWDYEKAIVFCEPFCFDDITNFPLALQILKAEHCFDNDPDDEKVLLGK